MNLIYIGPGIGLGGLIIFGLVLLLVVLSLGYLLWYKIKQTFKKRNEDR